jgi:hypothetical protein
MSPVDAAEIRALRAELREAVELLKRPESAQSKEARNARDVHTDERVCFIVMPFGPPDLQVVYEDFVRPVVEKCGLQCERGDDMFGSNMIMEDILTSIRRARLVVADLTGKNANVFYEVGICHALSKEVLLLAQSIEDVPFDARFAYFEIVFQELEV